MRTHKSAAVKLLSLISISNDASSDAEDEPLVGNVTDYKVTKEMTVRTAFTDLPSKFSNHNINLLPVTRRDRTLIWRMLPVKFYVLIFMIWRSSRDLMLSATPRYIASTSTNF